MSPDSPAAQWDPDFALRSPAFEVLRDAAAALPRDLWPDAETLTRLAQRRPRPPCNASGQPIRFVAAESDGAVAYERRILEAGEVACRARDWHDLMNALVWMTFPRAKAALNARHVAAAAAEAPGQRGRLRDALTVLDEGGAIVLSSDSGVLDDIRGFRWTEVFWRQRQRFLASTQVLVFGHAMYQKLLEPFVGISALALLIPAPADLMRADQMHTALSDTALQDATPPGADPIREDAMSTESTGAQLAARIAFADAAVAELLNADGRLSTPRDLSPLPILGVPGWFPANEHAGFYDDVTYFRPGRGGKAAA